MVILAVVAAMCCLGGFFAARFFALRQDVLYGPYIEAEGRIHARETAKRRLR
jgi:hypothetical protein